MNKWIAFAGLILLLGGLGAGVVSFTTSFWEEISSTEHRGIFQRCKPYPVESKSEVLCKNLLERDDLREDLFKNKWYTIILACHSVGVALALIATVLWLLSFCYHGSCIRLLGVLFTFIAAACFVASVVVWRFKWKESGSSEGWSFWIAVGAAAGTGVAAILMLVAVIDHRRRRKH